MRMLKISLIMLVFQIHAVYAQSVADQDKAGPRIYKSLHGDINLDKIEQVAWSQLGVPVSVVHFRWPYNPFQYWASTVTAASVAFYTIKLVVNKEYQATCTFQITWWNASAEISSCTTNGNDFNGTNLRLKVNLRYSDFMEEEQH